MSKKYEDLSGKQFGMLTVLHRYELDTIKVRFVCRCECEKEKIVESCHLTGGDTKSCGCLQKKDIIGLTFGYLYVINECGRDF